MFDPRLHDAGPDHIAVYGFYEKLYTMIDLSAALCFVVGSVMFFFDAWQIPGTWLFLVGSVFFAARLAVRFLREFHLARLPLPGDARK
ncbi:YrhK family protein [Tropicimonas sp. IMCC6043]|uniref:YrhK family protein n=1 Tax=Tropicimonas sp. IMCC6043 TaxID=2510645 RepID=UPI00101D6484|nr:YrhK family protein [Tropicimonas sp. IMCC6043]RYH11641.1 cobalamin biosynthesis protein CobQ [Tropicimonas sp. IMCC6043]